LFEELLLSHQDYFSFAKYAACKWHISFTCIRFID